MNNTIWFTKVCGNQFTGIRSNTEKVCLGPKTFFKNIFFCVHRKFRYPKHIIRSLGYLRDRFLDNSYSIYTQNCWDPLYRHIVSSTMACWWDTSLLFISTRQSHDSCTDIRLHGGHLSMNERTSPATQPSEDRASRLPSHSDNTAQFHHPTRFINNNPIVFGQGNLWPSKTTLQLKNFTTSERTGSSELSMKHNFSSRPLSFLGWTTAMLFCLDFQHVHSNHYKWPRTQQLDYSSMNPREPTSHSVYLSG